MHSPGTGAVPANCGGQNMEDLKRAMSVEQAAKAAGVGRTLLFEEIRRGRITARKVGRRTIITADDLDAWLKSLPIKAVHGGDHG
jgi:excisionase family DNA binding protein